LIVVQDVAHGLRKHGKAERLLQEGYGFTGVRYLSYPVGIARHAYNAGIWLLLHRKGTNSLRFLPKLGS
jgi:hypothetical protein